MTLRLQQWSAREQYLQIAKSHVARPDLARSVMTSQTVHLENDLVEAYTFAVSKTHLLIAVVTALIAPTHFSMLTDLFQTFLGAQTGLLTSADALCPSQLASTHY